MLNVAVIGAGVMGKHHARNYSEIPDCKLVAICDVSAEQGAPVAANFGAQFYTDIEDLLANEKLDAVSIVVPTKLHNKVARRFIEHGISVLIEKPLADSVEAAQELVDLAEKHKVVLLVGHIERFNPVITTLKNLINEGAFGDILSVVVKRVGLFPPRIKDVNVITDLAVHDLNIVCSIIGRLPDSIYARGSGALTNSREDHAEIFMNYGSFGCFIQVNWITPIKIRGLALTGTKGYAELNYITQELDVHKTHYTIKEPTEFSEFMIEFGTPERITVDVQKAEPLKLELENFINAVYKRNNLHFLPQEGVEAVLLSDAVNESIRSNKIVLLK